MCGALAMAGGTGPHGSYSLREQRLFLRGYRAVCINKYVFRLGKRPRKFERKKKRRMAMNMRFSANRKTEDVDVRSDEIARRAHGGPCIKVGNRRMKKSKTKEGFRPKALMSSTSGDRRYPIGLRAGRVPGRLSFAPTLITEATGYGCLISVAGNHESSITYQNTKYHGAHQNQLKIRFTAMFKSMVMIVSTPSSLNTLDFIKAWKVVIRHNST